MCLIKQLGLLELGNKLGDPTRVVLSICMCFWGRRKIGCFCLFEQLGVSLIAREKRVRTLLFFLLNISAPSIRRERKEKLCSCLYAEQLAQPLIRGKTEETLFIMLVLFIEQLEVPLIEVRKAKTLYYVSLTELLAIALMY